MAGLRHTFEGKRPDTWGRSLKRETSSHYQLFDILREECFVISPALPDQLLTQLSVAAPMLCQLCRNMAQLWPAVRNAGRLQVP